MAITASETYYRCDAYMYRNGASVPSAERKRQREAIKAAGFDLKKRFKTMDAAQEAARLIKEFTGIETEAHAGFDLAF